MQRLAAIAHGARICATHVAAPLLADIRTTADQHRRRHNN
jgi:hypothetical protein